MTSLFSNTVSPVKEGSSSLPRRASALSKPPLRALYDLLIAPLEGVRLHPHFTSAQETITFISQSISCPLSDSFFIGSYI